ncbi:MAG: monovalent cation/H(+) antiporter subunit G [Syntrophales bacterium]|nr:monovalent cation/H(+) antiporter subunit G [Syntrophales bacterium]
MGYIIAALSVVCLLGGLFFFATATIGLLRFPDFFTRLHATGKGDTLAVFLCLIGFAIHEGLSLTAMKIVVIAVFMFLAQPTATHAISRAGIRHGLKPWVKGEERQ